MIFMTVNDLYPFGADVDFVNASARMRTFVESNVLFTLC